MDFPDKVRLDDKSMARRNTTLGGIHHISQAEEFF